MSDSENEDVSSEQEELSEVADVAAEESELQVESDLGGLMDVVTKERDEYLDLARRLQADFENYKKRSAKQMQEHTERASEAVISKLLDVLDTIDLALHHEPSGPLEQVASSLRDVLGREGLERIDGAGIAFDPEVHDAVVHEDGDGTPEVIEVLRTGYKFRGRVIRPAMVKVKGAA